MSGYNKLAALMGAYPEVAIFRRFAALNAQNILHLQAEIVDLEITLREYESADDNSDDPARSRLGRNWYALSRSVRAISPKTSEGDPPIVPTASGVPEIRDPGGQLPCHSASRQYSIILELRSRLKDYNDAVIQQAEMTKLGRPNVGDLRFLKRWMKDTDMGNISLLGRDFRVYEDPDFLDLLATKPRPNESLLTTWLSDHAMKWLQQRVLSPLKEIVETLSRRLRATPSQDGSGSVEMQNPFRLDTMAERTGTVYRSETVLSRVAKVFGMCLSSVIPIASIVVLYYVKSMAKRLGIVDGFTALFSLTLGLVTSGELIGVFGASAGFAAVQVVFIGTESGSSNRSD